MKKGDNKVGSEDTFVEITNKDIYDSIQQLIKNNQIQHNSMIEHQLRTNGKVKLNRWISSTALAIVTLLIGLIARGIQ